MRGRRMKQGRASLRAPHAPQPRQRPQRRERWKGSGLPLAYFLPHLLLGYAKCRGRAHLLPGPKHELATRSGHAKQRVPAMRGRRMKRRRCRPARAPRAAATPAPAGAEDAGKGSGPSPARFSWLCEVLRPHAPTPRLKHKLAIRSGYTKSRLCAPLPLWAEARCRWQMFKCQVFRCQVRGAGYGV